MDPCPRLILASASPRRRELLTLLGLPFEVIPSAYDEKLPERTSDPELLAAELAAGKAAEVAAREPRRVVIGADTLVLLEDRVFGKPANDPDANRMLAELSGKGHRVVTGVCLCPPRGAAPIRFSQTTLVRFRALLPSEIRAYVATGEPMDKAGAYAIQGAGALLVEAIEGDYNNVVGLPLTQLALHLRALGFPILGAATSPAVD
jgi:septum formation protein